LIFIYFDVFLEFSVSEGAAEDKKAPVAVEETETETMAAPNEEAKV
jgi:hypothetical protein